MKYSDFLKDLSKNLNINLKTIHQSFVEANIDINKYLNQTTIRILKEEFNNYLMYDAINDLEISYQKIATSIHPTKLTNEK